MKKTRAVLALGLVGWVACATGQAGETRPAAEVVRPEPVGAEASGGPPAEPPQCQPATCEGLGLRCGRAPDGCGGVVDCGPCGQGQCNPEERDCCGVCVPRSEGRCPDNVHCPAALPER